MSRVYDAIRRSQPESGATVDSIPALPDALTVLPSEVAFPAEDPSTDRSSVAPAPAVVSPAADGSTAATTPVTAVAAVTSHSDVGADAAVDAMPSVAKATRGAFMRIDARYEGKTVVEAEVSPQSREQYRRLAATLHHAQAVRGTKVVMITSALVGEGKTLTASNVALTLSQSYQKQVLLIDADLRRPSLHAVFGIASASGLTDSLTSEDHAMIPVHQVSARLGIVAAGRPTSDPIAALTSDRMRQLVTEARTTFDWVILDTPPVALLTDASLVSSITDGAVIVVKAGHTPWDLVDRAVNAIGRERVLGAVLNHASPMSQRSSYYDNYYYSSSTETRQAR